MSTQALDVKLDFYLSLDELVDTRMACLRQIDENKALSIDPVKYNKRDNDFFPGFDQKVFKQIYSQRDEQTLKLAMITDIAYVLRDIVRHCAVTSAGSPLTKQPTVVLNTWPYELSDAVRNSFAGHLYKLLDGLVAVELVHLPIQELTPKYVKDRFSTVFMYDWSAWFAAHYSNPEVGKNPDYILPQVMLYAPALFLVAAPTPAEHQSMMASGRHPFREVEDAHAPIVALKFIDAGYFSISKRLAAIKQGHEDFSAEITHQDPDSQQPAA